MEKKLKKKAVKPIITPRLEQTPQNPSWHAYLPYVITSVFFILSLLGILNHELWRDEYQAWMVAADAHSIPELLENLRYEGHPFLWHLMLFVVTAITDDTFGMQLLHILISTTVVFLINKYSPFPVLYRILLSFGYFTFFEYNLISRSYGLGFLLVVIFCILYRQRHTYLLYMGGILFLLSNISIFGVILSVCLSGILLLEWIFPDAISKTPRYTLKQIGIFLIIAGSGILLGYLQIRPEANNSFPTLYVTDYDPVRLKWAFSRLIHAYFPLPDVTNFHFWNTNLFVPEEGKFRIGITPILFLLWVIAFLRYRLILVLYGAGTLILLGFYYYTGFVWSRYAGHLFLLMVACNWLLYFQSEKSFSSRILNTFSLIGQRIRNPFFLLILAISVCGGIYAYVMDLKHPFSTSLQAANYIRENNLDDFEIIGSKDYIISPLASQLDKDILYAERKAYGSFIIYDEKRNNIWSFSEVQNYLVDIHRTGVKKTLLVKNTEVFITYHDTGESIPWHDAMLTDTLRMTLLETIKPGIVHDENYFIYLVESVK